MNSGNPESLSVFKPEKPNLAMPEIIVDEGKFLSAFSQAAQQNAKNYYKALELNKTIENCSEIARRINQPKRTVIEWISGQKIPHAILAINELKSNNLLPLVTSQDSEAFNLFLEIFAFVYGDGSLKKDLGGIDLCGQKEDLIALKNHIEKTLGFNTRLVKNCHPSIITKENKGAIFKSLSNGSCFVLRIHSCQLSKLIYLAGAPKGDKITQPVTIPDWLMNSSKDTKQRFLGVLFGNELQCPYIRAQNAFTSAQLGFHKIESREKDLEFFLSQIRILLKEFGIATSPIASEKCRTIRKDGNRSLKVYFVIDSHSPNILRLTQEIPFKYAEAKQKRFEKEIHKFLDGSQYLKQEWKLYKKVMQMHENGLGRRTIFKQLKLPKKYFYRINSWIHYGSKPLYYSESRSFW
ncbi:MAG: hypothetical protein PHH08_03555 [Candidatus ainarchaeum sp.]|nr:hypothetical protein [Candidatus ainarchaeum sp.]